MQHEGEDFPGPPVVEQLRHVDRDPARLIDLILIKLPIEPLWFKSARMRAPRRCQIQGDIGNGERLY